MCVCVSYTSCRIGGKTRACRIERQNTTLFFEISYVAVCVCSRDGAEKETPHSSSENTNTTTKIEGPSHKQSASCRAHTHQSLIIMRDADRMIALTSHAVYAYTCYRRAVSLCTAMRACRETTPPCDDMRTPRVAYGSDCAAVRGHHHQQTLPKPLATIHTVAHG